VKTPAGIVPRSRNDENSLLITETNCLSQYGVSLAGLTQLTATDVDDVGSCFNRLIDGSG
jgi:hypothetical protein